MTEAKVCVSSNLLLFDTDVELSPPTAGPGLLPTSLTHHRHSEEGSTTSFVATELCCSTKNDEQQRRGRGRSLKAQRPSNQMLGVVGNECAPRLAPKIAGGAGMLHSSLDAISSAPRSHAWCSRCLVFNNRWSDIEHPHHRAYRDMP